MSGNITSSFSWNEFKCRDNTNVPLHLAINIVDLCRDVLQPIRDHYHKPVHITSGYRTPTYNRSVGGATKSQHMQGRAADITVAGVSTDDLFSFVKRFMKTRGKGGGVGYYRKSGFVHVDIRPTKEIAIWHK